MTRKATSQDVADLAGVSRSAVSLVLNGRAAGNIAPAKQVAILAAAAELNYTPNAVALSLRTRRTRTIGFVAPTRDLAAAAGSILQAALTAATAAGYLLLIMDSGAESGAEAGAVEQLRDRQVDGFLLVSGALDQHRLPEALGAASVLANRTDPDRRVVSLVADDEEAAFSAAELLLGYGHRILALVTDGTSAETAQFAIGVRRALTGAGLAPPRLITGGAELRAGWNATRELLAHPNPPTAIVASGERTAVGVALAAAAAGVQIPADLSVVTIGTITGLAAGLPTALTSMQRPNREIGALAIRLLLQQLASLEPILPQEIKVRYGLAERDSVAVPRRA